MADDLEELLWILGPGVLVADLGPFWIFAAATAGFFGYRAVRWLERRHVRSRDVALSVRADCVRLSDGISAVERAHTQLAGAGDALVRVQGAHVNPLALADREDLSEAIFRVRVAQAAMKETCDSLAELLVRLRQRWGVRP